MDFMVPGVMTYQKTAHGGQLEPALRKRSEVMMEVESISASIVSMTMSTVGAVM